MRVVLVLVDSHPNMSIGPSLSMNRPFKDAIRVGMTKATRDFVPGWYELSLQDNIPKPVTEPVTEPGFL